MKYFSALFVGPIEPKKFDFSYKPIRMPPISFWGLKTAKKGDSIAFLLSAVKFPNHKIRFLAFFDAKMTKIVILDQKLIVTNDYLQFWAHFEWSLSLFQISEVK